MTSPALPDELLAEVASRMAPDFEVYEVMAAGDVFDAVQSERARTEEDE